MLFEQIARNKRHTVYVMAAFVLLVAMIGAAVGYVFFDSTVAGLIMALVVSLVYIGIMVSQSTSVVMSMNHARELHSADDDPELWHTIEDMALVAKVPMPRVFIIDDPSPNAFATGNNPEHAAVAVTTGIQQRLNREEMEGVIGHEMTHIRNYDIRLQTIALALTAAISLLVNWGMNSFWWGGGRRRRDDDRDGGNGGLQVILMLVAIVVMILAPLAASLVQMALSRNREYLADAGSVELTRNPQGMIQALTKIDDSQPMQQADPSSAALYISDPIKKKSWSHLLATHPPIADRIARLEKM
ncbi:zinc metalloprotease HtpX [Lactiplantibacillus mudanjiangensis]|uniref:Protease HtpX homolog n=1 Tax=Lactiplantibacillus mudanjiangensis TaxID=1296538 RepID=A0A660DZ10_9LACO|nr:zinc metalloprotease HtpX [Lactiplantibacillus mudanjiangensis]VDG21431.1 heat shock protein HtpX [Lactobacillus plantarum JDM1] [Lactiplantibacillus mudanjiangensis]VDG26113.1 heat shock protein HtpX [Lactobacillus plantarum JDM1] [Lactiplantibacillus mudanjiangensis]VDG29048.1 heat shock protein HtpX [Lactobacillus plantarum JDM1] [Lactiplantibacillus mudanjiangensis]VDG31566.1 heat shock protein HtpX [Lactobacillus plantarum JDM1] [Lactiplantibacillus mudanjiangensis]